MKAKAFHAALSAFAADDAAIFNKKTAKTAEKGCLFKKRRKIK